MKLGEFFVWVRIWRKEQGKSVAEDLNQRTKNHEEQTEHIAAEGKGFVEEPTQMNNLFPKSLVTDETSNK